MSVGLKLEQQEDNLPPGWDRVSIGEISDLGGGTTPRKSNDDYWEGSIPWASPKDFEGVSLDETEDKLTEYAVSENSINLYNRGDIAMVVRSGVLRHSLPVAQLSTEMAVNQDIKVLKPDTDRIATDYLLNVLLYEADRIRASCAKTGTTVESIETAFLKGYKLPLPPLPEQRRIADILSTVDQQIQQTDEMTEKTEDLKRGLMQDLLIEGLSSGSTQEIQIGPRTLQIPAHWDMEPCGQLFEAINGRAFKTDEWEEEGTQIIRIQDLRPDAEAETNYADFEVDNKYHVTDGDLLFCWAGNIKTSLGAYIWSGDDSYLNQHIYNLRPKKDLDKRFFAFSLNQHLTLLKTMVGGSAGQVHITKTDFEGFKLPVPPVEEQERIADIIGCTQKKIDEEKGRKEDLQELKRGLMQDLLTGKIRVNAD